MMSYFGVGPFILMYHSIDNGSSDKFAVSLDSFREHLSSFLTNGFEFISLPSLVDSLKSLKHASLNKKVVLTFDDGYKDFLTNVLPVLQNHGIPATVFIVTDMIGGSASWRIYCKEKSLMSEDDLLYIKSQNITIGSHTVTHPNLTALSHEELYRQLEDSHAKLTYLGETFYSFAYPWGQLTSVVVDAVKKSGYECAAMVGGSMRLGRVDLYRLPRVDMCSAMEIKDFRVLFGRTRFKSALYKCFGNPFRLKPQQGRVKLTNC
jgi:peptidoglycan/xylan/chitin deacetylase (PgdA/CDA1 family)